MQDLMGRHWHHLPDAEIVDFLDADPAHGLDRLEAEERQRRFGPNALTPRKGRGPLLRFLDQFNQALVYVLLGLTLAFEPKEPGLMDRPRRRPGTPILNGVLLQRILLVGLTLLAGAFGLFEWALHHGASVEQARTFAVNVFAVGQVFYLLNCRSLRWSMFRIGVFSNPWLWAGISAMALVQLAFTYLPVMNRLFHSEPISAGYWLAILAVGLAIYTVLGLEKLMRSRGVGGGAVARPTGSKLGGL